jgi:hypothetical protein
MMNDPLVLRASESLARRLLGRAGLETSGRVGLAYLSAFGRPATPAEVERASEYLRRFDAALAAHGVAPDERPLRAWSTLCQAVLSSSEFLYLD